MLATVTIALQTSNLAAPVLAHGAAAGVVDIHLHGAFKSLSQYKKQGALRLATDKPLRSTF